MKPMRTFAARFWAWTALPLLALALLAGGSAAAQGGAPARKTPAASKPAKPAPTPAPAASVAARSGKGWRVGPLPAWVVAPPAPAPLQPGGASPTVPAGPAPGSGGARRELLVDVQVNHTLPRPVYFVRVHAVALDAGALGPISQPQVSFNPAFQTAVIHEAAVTRAGQRSDRLAEARIEPMRREQRLEQQIIDGNDTLLLVLADVRVGDVVEMSYSVEGENPIFEGRVSGGMQLAWETPVDVLHHRWLLPPGRRVNTRSLATDIQPERFSEGGHEVLRVVRRQVPALLQETGTPPWFKVYPAIDVSEYASWSEVDAWAQRLFALPTPTPAAVVERAAQLRAGGLQGESLASEALRFVQDEVRYFSVSLGESSHRPKPPQQTLAELLGDCKDKVVLLNALLRELGFEAKPALVSVRRNRGIRQYLPSHDLFDHVITRLTIGDKVWFLDPTVTGQGLELASRGHFPYGAALVVGDGAEPRAVPEGPAGNFHVEFEQRWDLSSPGRPAQLEFMLRAHGLAAERWRAGLAAGGPERLAQALSGGFARLLPGLQTQGTLDVQDDRRNNRFELRQRYEVPDFGRYGRGHLEAEFVALEMFESLGGPNETQRRTPFLVDGPRLVDSRIVVQAPVPLPGALPPALEVVDRQFRYSARIERQGATVTYARRYERREDQVQPADLAAWREKIVQARQATSGQLRLPLAPQEALMPELQRVERRLRADRAFRNDTLGTIVARNEFGRVLDTHSLGRVAPESPLAAKVWSSRAIANNLLGDFEAGRADAQKALSIRADDADALEAQAVALLGLGRAEESLATFARISPQARPAAVAAWMGSVHLHLGRAAEAEALLREAVAGGSGDGREFALLWLYLAAERQGGRGKAAIAEHVDSVDAGKLTGAILRYLAGSIDRDALLRVAGAKPEMERLNLAEAHFFIGQQHLAQGRRDEALRAFERVLDTRAVPFREYTYAQLELKRAGR
jgi:lipoprotein NlpI